MLTKGLVLLGLILAIPVLLILYRIGKIVFALLFLRTAARAALSDVGRRAVEKQPDRIHLKPEPAPAWRKPDDVEDATRVLREHGFTEVGAFSIPEMPDVLLRMLVNTSQSLTADVYDHAKVGVFMDIFARHADGTRVTAGNSQSAALDAQPGHTKVRVPGGTPQELWDRVSAEFPKKPRESVSAERAVAAFEEAYASEIAWRKARGGATPREVIAVARTMKDRQPPA